MAKKTIEQLKKELATAREKNKKQDIALDKKNKELRERRKLEDELKELTRSKMGKSLKRFSRNVKKLKKKNLTPERRAELRVQAIKKAKSAAVASKKVWNAVGIVVNRLDRMGNAPVQRKKPTKGRKKRRWKD